MNGWSILMVAGSAQGYFLAGVLFLIGKGNRRANRMLGGITLLLACILSYYFLFSWCCLFMAYWQ